MRSSGPLLLQLLQVAAWLILACSNVVPAAAALPANSNLDLLNGITIPPAIAVPSGNTPHVAFRAIGDQHYTFNGTQWVLRNATAKLYGSRSPAVVGRHFFLAVPDANGGQPTWEAFNHPYRPNLISAVTAKSIAAVRVDPSSITWNLLQATSHYGNTDEPLGHVTYVQRLKTRRGLPPSNTTGINVGATYASSYSAIYAYYVASA